LAKIKSRARKLNMRANAVIRSSVQFAMMLTDREFVRLVAARAAESARNRRRPNVGRDPSADRVILADQSSQRSEFRGK
jgi:hypothetical protein